MTDRKAVLDKLDKKLHNSEMANKFFKGQPTETEVIDVGDTVMCDDCSEDYTNNDLATGGLLFQSKAICPKCQEKWEELARKYNEEKYILARCPVGMSFKDFVLQIRGDNHFIKITTSKGGRKS
jgi:uncharacterized Zn ribbon protein